MEVNKIGIETIELMIESNLCLETLSIQLRDKSIKNALYAEYLVETLKFLVNQNFHHNQKLEHFPQFSEKKKNLYNINFKFRNYSKNQM